MPIRGARFDGFETASVIAAVASTFAGYFAGAGALSVAQALFGPSGSSINPYLAGAVLGLITPFGWGVLVTLGIVALCAHGVLRLMGARSGGAYVLAGAVVGIATGALVIGLLFSEPWRGVACGVLVGSCCGLLFRRIALGSAEGRVNLPRLASGTTSNT